MNEPALPVSALRSHRQKLTAALGDEIALIPSGLPVPVSGTDQVHAFRTHPEHYYLTGVAGPGNVLATDGSGGFTLFAHIASQEEKVWEGDTPGVDEIAERTGIEDVRPREQLTAWLGQKPVALLGNPDLAQRPDGYGLARFENQLNPEETHRLRAALTDARRTKDAHEIALMQRAADATAAGHVAGMLAVTPGMTEISLRTEIETEFLRSGGDRTAYSTIVGTGENSAVLHYSPSSHVILDGDLVLVDAGACYGGYMCDVTRTFPGGREMTAAQADLYDLVNDVQEAAIADCRPGKEYRELHLEACAGIARGMVELGYMKGDPEELVSRDAHALFFPHGLGHMIGLVTHDVGGYLEGRERSDRFGLRYLRTDIPLREGMVVTIEPGIYFIRSLLTAPELREKYTDAVAWDRIDGMLDFGGIRIEDDVHVTADRPEVLTGAIPKSRDEIHALRTGD